ncbi:MAG: hypothetical protein KDA93_25875, partial [Planctomycetaceae bacterium]|nr:hypothetical protein [Planctomycetaceae bacterium]
MPNETLFPTDSPQAIRQPKTDRLVLERLLHEATLDANLDESLIESAHEVLVKWADLESSGRLKKLKETQMQGDFLAEVLGEALGYAKAVDGAESWQYEQHYTIAGQTPDAVLGHFRPAEEKELLGVVELKGPTVHLDRDRSGGRTAIDQCWDYLVNTPLECRWGLVSNIVSFRLYERNSTKRAYEHFTLQSLRDLPTFKRFYVLFHRQGLIDRWMIGPPRTVKLLEESRSRQREVGDKLYDAYSTQRLLLIEHLHRELGHSLDEAVEMAQRLFDRVIFIAFCEDRGLLPRKTLNSAYERLPAFSAVTNPRWQNYKTLFKFVNEGGPSSSDEKNGRIHAYNGGLFAPSPADDLELDDRWTTFFNTIGKYDFADEVNLDVLGHLFERSITELEKLKESGLFGGNQEKIEEYAQMPQSAKRKRLGIYYTPPELTSRIVQYTLDELIDERFAAEAVKYGIDEVDARRGVAPDDPAFWQACLDILRNLKIVDPACGSGAFLFQAYNSLELRYAEVIGHLETGRSGSRLTQTAADAESTDSSGESPMMFGTMV